MNTQERVRAAFRREAVDRVPVSLWRHFPEDDQTPEGLAKAVLAFQRKYGFDLVKVTPSSDYMAFDWGVRGVYRGNLEGTREVVERPIHDAGDWLRLRPLDPGEGSLGRQLDALRLVAKDLAGEVPFLQTVFSPLTTARKVGGDRWVDDLRRHPDVMHAALAAIAETTMNFARESLKAGADGIFYATQAASRKVLGEVEHRDFGQRYDLPILEGVAASSALNLLHLHGEDVMFDLANVYPVAAVNWHDRRTAPSLKEALSRCKLGLAGGLNELSTMVHGTPDLVAEEAAEAIAQTGGRGLLLGAGCVIRIDTPDAHIRAVLAVARAATRPGAGGEGLD